MGGGGDMPHDFFLVNTILELQVVPKKFGFFAILTYYGCDGIVRRTHIMHKLYLLQNLVNTYAITIFI